MNNNKELWREYKTNPTTSLKKQLILNYTNLVHYVVHRFKFSPHNILDERDYFQYGIEGLNEAVDRFDPDYGTKFETYAIQRIRGKIIDELRKLQSKYRVESGDTVVESFFTNVSIDRSNDDEDGITLAEIIPNDSEAASITMEKDELKELLINTISNLNERDRLILSLYYYEELNYKEIANILKITISRVSQIHSKIIKELKSKLLAFHE